MAGSLKDKAEEVGQKMSEAATRVGNKVSESVEEASDWAKEKAHQAGHRIEEAVQQVEHKTGVTLGGSSTGTATEVREHQDVLASCGTKVGRVDHVQGNFIKLTKNDSPDGRHHLIPLSWVASVRDVVHLNKDHVEVQREWQDA